ncbi:alcohol dehydrogenase catalytic domain-containing protein [Enterococcus casseliflavus]|uniref:alcohol dehydrogenase catalytic domain-containing protein n=1 Tax=Enterococcus casseliflavus TaxID=37734 RepID=UPI001BCE5465|nr:alcohol dehydrogenase catalytic domain-containing protein [Enterococcus casseliflavus]
MKAALMYGANDIRIEEISKPEYDAEGLLLKVEVIGLCGSDIRNLTTDSRKGDYPHIYGHEVVGTVAEVGDKCTKFSVGDRLYVYPAVPCLNCEYCRAGNSHSCKNLKAYDRIQGGFAEYMAVPAWGVNGPNIYKIPEDVSFETAVMAEPLSSVYACQDNVNVQIGQTVVIVGAGPIGCLQAELAKIRGANKVIMVEINDQRLEESKGFGVDYTINSLKTDAIAEVKRLTSGQGAEVVISANPSTKAQTDAVYMVKANGTLVFFGGVPKGQLTDIDTNYLHYNSIWTYGHYGSNTIQVKESFEMIISGRIDASKYVSKVMPLTELFEAIQLMRNGKANKVLIKPWM